MIKTSELIEDFLRMGGEIKKIPDGKRVIDLYPKRHSARFVRKRKRYMKPKTGYRVRHKMKEE